MSLDSAASFEERARALGLGAFMDKFRDLNWETMGKFAFAAGFRPGVTDDSVFRTEIFTPLLGGPDAEPRLRPLVRRLFFEAFTLSAADMKRQLDRGDDDAPRRVPNVERESRKEALEKRLTGVRFDGELECSDGLIDICIDLHTHNQLEHVRWEVCTKKLDETRGVKRMKEWKPDHTGAVQERTRTQPVTMTIHEHDRDLGLKMEHLLKRRSAALEIAGIMTYEEHENWTQELMETFLEAPPPGYLAPGLHQLVRADQEMFHQLGRLCRKGIRVRPDGKLPMDVHLAAAMNHRRVRLHLNPLPMSKETKKQRSPSRRRQRTPPRKPTAERPGKKERDQVREDELRAKAIDEVFRREKGAKGGGKDKGGRGTKTPKDLIGHNTKIDGVPLCYAYNLSSCSNATPGQKCNRGLHACARKGCEKAEPHGFSECPRRFG